MAQVILNCILNLKISLKIFNRILSVLLFYIIYKNEKTNYFIGYGIFELGISENVEEQLLKCENELPQQHFMLVFLPSSYGVVLVAVSCTSFM